jgi:hypothetical protein
VTQENTLSKKSETILNRKDKVKVKKVKFSPLQALEALRVVRG